MTSYPEEKFLSVGRVCTSHETIIVLHKQLLFLPCPNPENVAARLRIHLLDRWRITSWVKNSQSVPWHMDKKYPVSVLRHAVAKTPVFLFNEKLVISACYVFPGCWHGCCNKNKIHGEIIAAHSIQHSMFWRYTMKKTLLAVAAIATIGLAGYQLAEAQPWGGGPGMGPGCAMMGGPGQGQGQMSEETLKAREKFFNETTDLRKKMFSKKTELDAVMSGEKPDEKKLKDSTTGNELYQKLSLFTSR